MPVIEERTLDIVLDILDRNGLYESALATFAEDGRHVVQRFGKVEVRPMLTQFAANSANDRPSSNVLTHYPIKIASRNSRCEYRQRRKVATPKPIAPAACSSDKPFAISLTNWSHTSGL
jgi:hypothetical protein